MQNVLRRAAKGDVEVVIVRVNHWAAAGEIGQDDNALLIQQDTHFLLPTPYTRNKHNLVISLPVVVVEDDAVVLDRH